MNIDSLPFSGVYTGGNTLPLLPVWRNWKWNNAQEILDAVLFSGLDNTELSHLDVIGAYCIDNRAEV